MAMEEDSPPSVWRELRDQRDILIRMESMMTTLVAGHADHETRLRTLESFATNDHADRLNSLERWRYALPTTAFILASVSIGSSIFAFFTTR